MNIFTDLKRREARLGRPLNVAVVGAGFLGKGLVHQLSKIQGMCPLLVANRTLEKAQAALMESGVDPARIVRCEDPEAARRAIESGYRVITTQPTLPAFAPEIDALLEATGTLHIGTEVALASIGQGKHIVEANPEVQVTVGSFLKVKADEAGVVYSDIDGDQPGIIMNLYNYTSGLGLKPVVLGNCKGVMKRYATPLTQAAFAAKAGISPWIATAAADGTKLNLEMAIVANAAGMKPIRTGMSGLETSLEALLSDFQRTKLLDGPPIVEYTLGIPSGVFVIARSDDCHLQGVFRYLKMGDGPNYLFYRPYVLCQFEAPLTVAEAVLYGTATITPGPEKLVDVATHAKQDLRAGEPLGAIGGANHYGLIMDTGHLHEENALPIGLAEYAELKRDIRKDALIRFDDVVLNEEALVVRLRKLEEKQTRSRNS